MQLSNINLTFELPVQTSRLQIMKVEVFTGEQLVPTEPGQFAIVQLAKDRFIIRMSYQRLTTQSNTRRVRCWLIFTRLVTDKKHVEGLYWGNAETVKTRIPYSEYEYVSQPKEYIRLQDAIDRIEELKGDPNYPVTYTTDAVSATRGRF